MAQSLTREEAKTKLNKITDDLFRPINKHDEISHLWLFLLILITGLGLVAWIIQMKKGLVVTAMRDYVSWGMYIANFVFFVAVSLIGSLISSIMHLLKIHWAKPISRVAEQVAIAAVTLASIIIITDMGRPDRFLNVFLHGRFASPILWDVTVITTYMVISILLFYLPLIPDIALLRDRMKGIPSWQSKLYKILALGWKGSSEQFKKIYHSMRVLMILIIPVALAIHTVTSWLFAATLRPGWDTTIFGPYFVTGAFVAGTAAVIITMYVYRSRYRLHQYFSESHFDNMGKLLVLVMLVYFYFNINEFLVPGYKMKTADGAHLQGLFSGHYAPMFYLVQIGGLILPIILLLFKSFRKPSPILVISIFVLLGAWFKRYLIVIPTMQHPFLPIQNVPDNFHTYIPTGIEIAVTMFAFGSALLIITLLSKLFPVITVWEYAEGEGIDLELLNEKKD
ncbi:NrfD/PsrC family molybdoenzyme membrane anchor subunit [Bacteroidota bacterium]